MMSRFLRAARSILPALKDLHCRNIKIERNDTSTALTPLPRSDFQVRNFSKKFENHMKRDKWTKYYLYKHWGEHYAIVTVDGLYDERPSKVISTGGYLMVNQKLCRWFYSLQDIGVGETLFGEFEAMFHGLLEAKLANVEHLIIRSDSEHAIEIMQAVKKAKQSNLPTLSGLSPKQKKYADVVTRIFNLADTLVNVEWVWLQGNKNVIADSLSRKANDVCYESKDAKIDPLPQKLQKNFSKVA